MFILRFTGVATLGKSSAPVRSVGARQVNPAGRAGANCVQCKALTA